MWQELPARFHLKQLQLVFATVRDGYGLSTLLARAGDEAPTVMLVRTAAGERFGAYCSFPWCVSLLILCIVGGALTPRNYKFDCDKNYFGNGECFVFSLTDAEDRPAILYPWVGIPAEGDMADLILSFLFRCLFAFLL